MLTRLILQAKAAGVRVPGFSNHQRRAKRRMLAIMNAKNQKQRKAAYMDLLKMAENVLDYARATERNMLGCFSLTVFAISEAVKHNADLMVKVIDQTRRRSCWVRKYLPGKKWFRYLNPILTLSSRTGERRFMAIKYASPAGLRT